MRPIPFSLRRLWTRAILRSVHYGDRYQQLDMLYRIADPWDLDNPRERIRFEQTNRLIQREFGKVASLLEVGCGEGHQSQYLAKVCDRLHGCDVSPRAVERARKRCETSTFSVGTLSDLVASGAHQYDLLVACEVLYYMKDIPAAIQIMSRLSKSFLITYYQMHQEQLDKIVIPLKPVGREIIGDGDNVWTAVWWHNN
ncbi:2-polyprenyl-3-methyl-5-hydroxy-6-metoxy-1,4-benzoquinol methylase [Bradyrhizobium sp. AZCC 1578]|uniref:class I SAM-dependent methyltransferase n=1 Tax=Bradyrhizobium sp. AZCC 1578 TaxID=3117027 RepID=UPI002FF2A07D